MQDLANMIGILNGYFNIVVVIICACIGYVLKNAFPKFDNRFIPLASAVLGIALTAWGNWGFSLEILATGLVSGLAATGLYEAVKNMINKFGNSVSEKGGE